MTDLIKKKLVKEYLKEKDCKMSGDLVDVLNMKVEDLLNAASLRANLNGRSTVQSKDL